MTWLLLAQVTHPIVSRYIEFLTHTHLPFLTFPRLFFLRLCGSKGLLYIYFSLKHIYRSGWLFKIYVVIKLREQSSWNQYILTFSFLPLLSYFCIEKLFSTYYTVLVYLFVFMCSCFEPVLVKSNNRSEHAKKNLFLSML